MLKSWLPAIFVGLATFVQAGDLPALVAFGDSISDMGNQWVARAKNPSSFKPTWVTQLTGSSMLNLPGFKPSGKTSFYGGTNYAVGGATTDYAAAQSFDPRQNLTEQVSRRYLNPAFNPAGVQKDALHSVLIGANDLMIASVSKQQIITLWTGFDQVGASVARSTENQISALAAAGVKHILWGNLFDIGQTPMIRGRARSYNRYAAPLYLAAIAKAVVAHNQEMDAAIERLHQAYPSLDLIKLDLAAMFTEIAANPAKFGFVDVVTGANDTRHLFSSDGLHPTPQGHKVLAEYAYRVINARRSTAH